MKPRQVQIDAAGWTVTGMKPNGVPEDQVFFVEQNRSASAKAAYDQKDFFPVVRIERELELGLIWQVRTKVKRLSPTGKAISLSVPLLAAERVMSANINASNGRIEVRFGAGDEEVTWESELAPVPDLTLKAEASESWVERWTLTASPVWNVHHEGLAPVYETSQAQLVPVWTPWPGESVKLTVSRPEAVQGATTTISSATMEGAAFFQVCLLEKVPFTAFRAISNYITPRNKAEWEISLAIDNLNERLIQLIIQPSK